MKRPNDPSPPGIIDSLFPVTFSKLSSSNTNRVCFCEESFPLKPVRTRLVGMNLETFRAGGDFVFASKMTSFFFKVASLEFVTFKSLLASASRLNKYISKMKLHFKNTV